MNISDKKVIASLYLHGDNLNPDDISNILGILPSGAHRKGDKRTPSATGREYVPYRSGLWSLVLDRNHAEVMDIMAELLTILAKVNLSLASLPGVQDAYFDVFIAGLINQSGQGKCEFELEGQQLSALARFGIPIHFTVDIGHDSSYSVSAD